MACESRRVPPHRFAAIAAASRHINTPVSSSGGLLASASTCSRLIRSLHQTKAALILVREPKSDALLEAIGGPRFLVAQFFTILGTIFGVYLASYVAFQRNLKYDRFVKAQQRSDLLMAMREKLKRKLNERLPADVGDALSENDWPRLRLFVWQAARRSSSALDMPQIIIDMQSFYDDINDMLNDRSARQSFWSLTTSNTYERRQFKERLNNQLKFVEASIFPAMKEATIASAQLLKRYAS
jgi:hypothetical protein